MEAENTQIAGKVCAPQKCPPARTIEIFSKFVVGEAPKPFIGYPKSNELIVIPE
ncbi:hypothetical protein D3C87_2120730 [compost metagenome]